MANSVISTKDYDGATNVRIRVTGILDTSDFAQADITTISAMNPVPTFIRLDSVQFFIEDTLSCMLWWHDTAGTSLIMPLAGRNHAHLEWYGGITNPKNAGVTGNVQLSTTGWATGKILHFTLLLDFTKQGV